MTWKFSGTWFIHGVGSQDGPLIDMSERRGKTRKPEVAQLEDFIVPVNLLDLLKLSIQIIPIKTKVWGLDWTMP